MNSLTTFNWIFPFSIELLVRLNWRTCRIKKPIGLFNLDFLFSTINYILTALAIRKHPFHREIDDILQGSMNLLLFSEHWTLNGNKCNFPSKWTIAAMYSTFFALRFTPFTLRYSTMTNDKWFWQMAIPCPTTLNSDCRIIVQLVFVCMCARFLNSIWIESKWTFQRHTMLTAFVDRNMLTHN